MKKVSLILAVLIMLSFYACEKTTESSLQGNEKSTSNVIQLTWDQTENEKLISETIEKSDLTEIEKEQLKASLLRLAAVPAKKHESSKDVLLRSNESECKARYDYVDAFSCGLGAEYKFPYAISCVPGLAFDPEFRVFNYCQDVVAKKIAPWGVVTVYMVAYAGYEAYFPGEHTYNLNNRGIPCNEATF